ncbi:MAG: ferritin-like domain-containing protein [Oculatellaceae cyanobacterium bins.114]|nr:ferritin-like domain-containing protein [Oculatellaceae cyanobacterium bins.114]
MMNVVAYSQRSVTGDSLDCTSADWLTYFRFNRENLRSLPWERDIALTAVEKLRIAYSISYFQLGESSEGAHLMRLSRDYAERVGDRHWVETVKLFIGEEQRHAKDLGRFMQQQQLPLAKQHWSDTWFRTLRRLANLEVALMVLLTAELVATLYYPALGSATQSPLLHDLCQQIHHDEMRHVQFQTETLHRIWRLHPHWRQRLTQTLYPLFFQATLIVVWVNHAPVLKAAGYSFTAFFQRACAALQSSLLEKKNI